MTIKTLKKIKGIKEYIGATEGLKKALSAARDPEERAAITLEIEFDKSMNELRTAASTLITEIEAFDALRGRMAKIAHSLFDYYEKTRHGGGQAVYWHSAVDDFMPEIENSLNAECALHDAYRDGREDAKDYWAPRYNNIKRKLEKRQKDDIDKLAKNTAESLRAARH